MTSIGTNFMAAKFKNNAGKYKDDFKKKIVHNKFYQ